MAQPLTSPLIFGIRKNKKKITSFLAEAIQINALPNKFAKTYNAHISGLTCPTSIHEFSSCAWLHGSVGMRVRVRKLMGAKFYCDNENNNCHP